MAGVAHEINTPIGVAITATSHLDSCIQSLDKQIREGTLTRSDMEHAMAELQEAAVMTMKNLDRSAALVKSFKMVAVDQSSDDIREFDVKAYIEDIIMSLQPQLRPTQHKVNIEIDSGIRVMSSPGALSQIISNLVMNSLFHGFEHLDSGTIDIVGSVERERVQIDYYDNGKGLAAEIKENIFEPFVTTARARGGSGLGTHILYNLVTQVLGGTVSVMDDTAQGVHFCIRFPFSAPDCQAQKNAS